MRNAFRQKLAPQGALEEMLVDEIVADAWRLRRIPILEAAVHARDQQELIVKETTAQIAGIIAAAERDIALEMLLRSEKREFTPEERKALDTAQANLKEARTRLDEPTIRVRTPCARAGTLVATSGGTKTINV